MHDPSTSLRTGDVVAIQPGWPTSQHKRHIVKHIIAPYGSTIAERPPVPALEELIVEYEGKKAEKEERRAARRAAQYAQKNSEKGKTERPSIEAQASH